MNKIEIINPRPEISINLEKANDVLLLIINHYDSRYGFETTHYGISQENSDITFGIIPLDKDWTHDDITLIKLNLNENYSHFYSRNKEQEIIAFVPNQHILNTETLVACHNVTNFDQRHGEFLSNPFIKEF